MEIRHFAFIGIGIAAGFGLANITSAPAQERAQKTLTVQDFPNLAEGLLKTPGILDVKTSSFDGGKQAAIFAWFKNKGAVQAWYTSKMHQDAMRKFFPNMPGRAETLTGFKDDKSPVLVVATVTPSNKANIEGSPLAVSQIAIEMYTPVPGGLTIGGGFGPNSLEVPGLTRIEIKPNSGSR